MNGDETHIVRALELAKEMSVLAEEGEANSRDDGCAVLYGVIRDCAYQIKGRAERERKLHKGSLGNDGKQSWW